MAAEKAAYPLRTMCQVLGVSRSGFYAWRSRAKSERQRQNETLTEQIQVAYEESDGTYGSPRIYSDLKEADIPCGEKRIARLMRLHQDGSGGLRVRRGCPQHQPRVRHAQSRHSSGIVGASEQLKGLLGQYERVADAVG